MKPTPQPCNLEWVAKAASKDATRPVLAGVFADDKVLVATDGHRLHLAPNLMGSSKRGEDGVALPPGIWLIGKQAGDVQRVEGNYPNYETLFQKNTDFGWVIQSVEGMLSLARAGEAVHDGGNGGFLCFHAQSDEPIFISPSFVRRTLEGMRQSGGPIYISAPTALSPVLFYQPESGRRAIVMPVRTAGSVNEWGIFKVGELVAGNTKSDVEIPLEVAS